MSNSITVRDMINVLADQGIDVVEEEHSLEQDKTQIQVFAKPASYDYLLKVQEIHGDLSYSELTQAFGDAKKGRDRLTMEIASPGGSVDGMFSLWGVVTNFFYARDITAEVASQACSGGAILFMMCDKRIMGEGALLMFHNFSCTLGGHVEDVRQQLDVQQSRLTKLYDKYLRSYMSPEEYDKMMEFKDVYFDVDQACAYRLCTHVKTFSGEIITSQEYLAR